MMDTANSRSTCHARQASVDFWLWFYQSAVVNGLLATREVKDAPNSCKLSHNQRLR